MVILVVTVMRHTKISGVFVSERINNLYQSKCDK